MKTVNHRKPQAALFALCLMSAVLLLATHQAAAFFKKKEAENKPAEAVNRDQYPLMVFERGLLQGDMGGSWMLGNTPLILTRDSRVSNGSAVPQLESGQEAVVMGYHTAEGLVVYQATMISTQQTMEQGRFYDQRVDAPPVIAPSDLPR
jgi:hypothetical protein